MTEQSNSKADFLEQEIRRLQAKSKAPSGSLWLGLFLLFTSLLILIMELENSFTAGITFCVGAWLAAKGYDEYNKSRISTDHIVKLQMELNSIRRQESSTSSSRE